MHDSVNQAERIFASVLSLERHQRPEYLDHACRDSPELRANVERLLAEDERAGSFLMQPLVPRRLPAGGSPPVEFGIRLGIDSGAEIPHAPRLPGNAANGSVGDIPQFKPGDLLYGRFVVLRYIARGGMGEVYEVEDLQLKGARVALKTILSHYAGDPLMHERFKREVLVAREIVHPHVCPIYDLFVWDRPEGRLLFLTMKLLAGETLADRIAHDGKLCLADIVAITRQVGSGLAAAHAAGVLHRDIKAANILLNGAGSSIYACITDFGLARAMTQDGTALTVHGVPGTPGYVAPELFYGEPPSQASDLFAFGVVLFQMFTGHLPRNAITDPQTRKDLQEAGVPAAWRRVIESCLQPRPADRCRDIASALKLLPGLALDPILQTRSQVSAASHPAQLSRRRVLALAGATVAASGAGAWIQWERILNWIEPLPAKRAVALIAWPLGEANALVSTVIDSIRQRLARAEANVRNLVIVSIEDLPPSIRPASDTKSSPSLLGANLVLATSLQQSASRTRLNLQLLSADSGHVLRKSSITCLPAEISTLSEKASEEAAALLQLPRREIQVKDPEELRNVSADVFQAFSEAEQLMREPNHSGMPEAIAKYQHALELDGHFALGYARLAIAYVENYIVSRDAANLDLADKNASSALRYNPASAMGLLARALVYLYEGRAAQALDFFAKALQADPGNPEILLRKARALENKGELNDAEKVYHIILAERPNYWPAYNDLGEVLARQAKYQEAAKAFAAAGAAAPKVSLPMANLGTTYVQLGNPQAARQALMEALRRGPDVNAYLALGDIEFADGKYNAARGDYEEAAKLQPTYHLAFRNIADCYAMTGDSRKVVENYSQAAHLLSASVATNPQDGYNWATLAFYHAKLGNSHAAESAIKEAEHRAADVETRFMVTQALALLGRKQEALKLLLWCMEKGLSPDEVNLALDLKELRADPRYLQRIKNRPPTLSGSTS